MYAFFEEELEDASLFAMYHQMTTEEEKACAVKSIADADGTIWVLLATVAFGMGVDAKAVHSKFISPCPNPKTVTSRRVDEQAGMASKAEQFFYNIPTGELAGSKYVKQ